MNFENKWQPNESDSEYEDDVLNEVPPQDIDQKFRDNVLDIKHIIYDNTVLSKELGTNAAQNNQILRDYLKQINQVYILCVNAQKGAINDKELQQFPENVREQLRLVLVWLSDYFRKNRIPDTIPYENYIKNTFHTYQFVQDNSFE